jgi:hypothetical protein
MDFCFDELTSVDTNAHIDAKAVQLMKDGSIYITISMTIGDCHPMLLS